MLQWLQDSAGWLVGVLGGITAAGVIGRWMLKRVRRFAGKWDNAREALVGRDEIRHPDTGRVLAPATPSLNQRLAGIEETLIAIGDTRQEMHDLGQRVGDLADQLGQHVTESNELELARTREREEMWHAIKAVATPQTWDGNERRTQ